MYNIKNYVLFLFNSLNVCCIDIIILDNHDILGVKFFELESKQKQDDDYSNVQPSASIFSPPRGNHALYLYILYQKATLNSPSYPDYQ